MIVHNPNPIHIIKVYPWVNGFNPNALVIDLLMAHSWKGVHSPTLRLFVVTYFFQIGECKCKWISTFIYMLNKCKCKCTRWDV